MHRRAALSLLVLGIPSTRLLTGSSMTHYDDLRGATEAAEAEYNQAVAALRSTEDQLAQTQTQLIAAQAELDALKAQPPAQPAQPPAKQTALLGAAFKAGESLPAAVKHIDFHRFFFSPGDLTQPQTWAGQKNLVKAHDQYGCRTFSISFKPDGSGTVPFAASSITNMNRFLDSIPKDVQPGDVHLTFWHEHDDDLRKGTLTLARYRAGSEQVADVAHSHGMLYGPIHNGNTRQNGTTGPWGLWPAQWAANEADTALYDFWGVDCYSPNYEAPSPRMDPLKAYADTLHLPLLIGEMASPFDDAAKQTTWAKQARTWALKNAYRASWWSSQVSATSTNYRLTDAAAKEWFAL